MVWSLILTVIIHLALIKVEENYTRFVPMAQTWDAQKNV